MKQVFFIFLALILLSCSDSIDNSFNPGETNSLFPIQEGNYWVYDVYSIDSTGKETHSNWLDSIVVTGRQDSLWTIYEKQKDTVNTYMIAKKTIYVSSDYFSGFFKMGNWTAPLNLKPGFIPLIQNDSLEWIVGKDSIINMNLLGLIINGEIKIKGQKGAEKQVDFYNKSRRALEFVIDYNFKGTAKAGIDVDTLDVTIPMHLWYIENIGMFERTIGSFSFDLKNAGHYFTPGKKEILKRYLITN